MCSRYFPANPVRQELNNRDLWWSCPDAFLLYYCTRNLRRLGPDIHTLKQLLDFTLVSSSKEEHDHTNIMGRKRVLCSYGVDLDAVSGWLGSYGGEDSENDISRGEEHSHQPA